MQNVPPEEDYYKTLGVGENATANEIEKAFKSFAKTEHPDKVNARLETELRKSKITAKQKDQQYQDAVGKFQAVSNAHDILSDPIRRKEYDARHKQPQYKVIDPSQFPKEFENILNDHIKTDLSISANVTSLYDRYINLFNDVTNYINQILMMMNLQLIAQNEDIELLTIGLAEMVLKPSPPKPTIYYKALQITTKRIYGISIDLETLLKNPTDLENTIGNKQKFNEYLNFSYLDKCLRELLLDMFVALIQKFEQKNPLKTKLYAQKALNIINNAYGPNFPVDQKYKDQFEKELKKTMSVPTPKPIPTPAPSPVPSPTPTPSQKKSITTDPRYEKLSKIKITELTDKAKFSDQELTNLFNTLNTLEQAANNNKFSETQLPKAINDLKQAILNEQKRRISPPKPAPDTTALAKQLQQLKTQLEQLSKSLPAKV
jgi:curved DNA-binding protein CbpA